jgi:hypothetical protein
LKPLVHSDFAGVPELAQLVSTPARTTPLRILPFTEEVRLELEAPRGFRLAAPPPEVSLRGLVQAVSGDGRSLVVTRRVTLRPGRVDSSEYDAFRRDVGAVIRAMESVLRFVPEAIEGSRP